MKRILVSEIFIMCLILTGCAGSKMTSFKDPNYSNSNFQYLIVEAYTTDFSWRKKIESKLVKKLNKKGIKTIESFTIFPPTKKFTNKEKVRLLHDKFSMNSSTSRRYGWLRIFIGKSGTEKGLYITSSIVTPTKKPWSNFSIDLIDLRNGDTAWVAQSFTIGNAFANFDNVIGSFCSKTVKMLLNDGLIKKAK